MPSLYDHSDPLFIEVMAANLDEETLWTAYEIVKQCNMLAQEDGALSPAESLLDACVCCLIQKLETFSRCAYSHGCLSVHACAWVLDLK